jgi:hypothetical protein
MNNTDASKRMNPFTALTLILANIDIQPGVITDPYLLDANSYQADMVPYATNRYLTLFHLML